DWEFAVTNFGTQVHSLPPSLITPGTFAGSSPMQDLGGTNASILASPIPEPSALTATTAVVVSTLLVRRTRPPRAPSPPLDDIAPRGRNGVGRRKTAQRAEAP